MRKLSGENIEIRSYILASADKYLKEPKTYLFQTLMTVGDSNKRMVDTFIDKVNVGLTLLTFLFEFYFGGLYKIQYLNVFDQNFFTIHD